MLFNSILNTDNDYQKFIDELNDLYVVLIKKQIREENIPLIESIKYTVKRDLSNQNDIQKHLKDKIEYEN
jgi:hemerythrin-like domain-containing protein